MATIKQDNHASAVIQIDEYNNTPVLIHHGGRYPSLVNDKGVRIEKYIDVALYYDGYHVSARAEPGADRQPRGLHIGVAHTLEEAADFYHAAWRSIAEIPALYDKAETVAKEFARWNGPISRDVYEAIARDNKFDALSDAEISNNYAVEYGDFDWPSYTLEECVKYWSHQRRLNALKKEEGARKSQTRNATAAEMTTLRTKSVSHTEKRLVPIGTPHETLSKSKLYTVVNREPHGIISEDDPSIYGSHLLGHEGEHGEVVTFDVRE